MNNKKIAVIGVGNMGGAIVTGLIKSGFIPTSEIYVFDSKESIMTEMGKTGVVVAEHTLDAAGNADVIIVAVKPYLVEKVIREIKPALNPGKILISIAAGISIVQLQKICGEDIPVYRAMPNTAIAIHQSLTCITGKGGSESDLNYVTELFDNLGRTIQLPEDQMAAATVLSSCGIAFALRFIRAAIEGGIEIGFGAETAAYIAAQTVKGAADLLLETGHHPEKEIDKVTTPGGITITGLNEMEHEGFSSSVIKGIMASYNKIGR